MKHNLRTLINEKVKESKNITDTELQEYLNKNGYAASVRELNRALLHLEILGLVTVRWMGKDKRRIEVGTRTVAQPRTIW